MTRTFLLSATILVGAMAAHQAGAQPISGLYIGGGGGANFLQRQRVESLTLGNSTSYANPRVSFDSGVVALGNIGWGFGNGLRLELEGNYRYNRFSPLSNVTSSGGNEKKYGGMLNVLFDLDISSPYVYPYIGAGLGYARVEQTMTTTAGNSRVSIDGGDNAFAYQAIAGLSFPVPWVVGLSLTTEYRYYAMTGEREFPLSASTVAPLTTVTGRYKTSENYNHSLMLGVRYAFNVAPPPVEGPAPAAAPQAEAARTYLVFFDWDRADLTDRARQIIAEAASASQRVAVTRIEVSGHTDTTGSAAYNQALSVRRANNVTAELVRLGVPRAAINTQGFGFSHPLVATGAGVREPQNRRVEIVLK